MWWSLMWCWSQGVSANLHVHVWWTLLCSHSPADKAGGTTGWRQSFVPSSNSFPLHSSLGSAKWCFPWV